jgi:putative transposase
MQWLGTAYTRRFNVRHRQSGHLFQGRFKSILVEDDSYFINLSCYIHCNPLRAGIVKRLGDYQWSSYPHYAYGQKSPEWLSVDCLLSCFGNDCGRYRDKVKAYAKEFESIWEKVKYGCIFGSQAFRDHIRDKYLSGKPDKELPQLNQFLKNRDPGKIIREAAEFLDCDINMFRDSGRLTGESCDKRDILIRLLWETGNFSNPQIGEYFGLSYSSVSRRLSRVAGGLRSDGDNRIKELHQLLSAKIKV